MRVAHDLKPNGTMPLAVEGSTIPVRLRFDCLNKLVDVLDSSQTEIDHIRQQFSEKERLICISSIDKRDYKAKMAQLLMDCRNVPLSALAKPMVPEVIVLDEPSYDQVVDYLVSAHALESSGFPGSTVQGVDEEFVKCDRCQTLFQPDTYYAESDPQQCFWHDGKILWINTQGKREKTFSCCNFDGNPCSVFPKHVFKRYDHLEYRRLPDAAGPCRILALDCEMIYTTRGSELARITVVGWDENPLLDLLVKPQGEVVDYNTNFSGVDHRSYTGDFCGFCRGKWDRCAGPADFETAQQLFLELAESYRVVLVGHSLENDLHALGIIHTHVIDTSILYPHPRPSYKYGLKTLAATHLNEFIQQGAKGHSSFEDAVATLRLFKLAFHTRTPK